MVNQIVLVGRIAKAPEVKTSESGRKYASLTLAVPRNYKNINGEYDTDFLDCTLWTGIAENTAEYCKKGDVIGVRGRLQSRIIEKEDGTKFKKMEIIADKVTFLSTGKVSDKEEEDNIVSEEMNGESDDKVQKMKENKNKKNK